MATILIVDDEPWMRRALARVLGGRHCVVAATSVEEAISLLGQFETDVVVCDLKVGARSGLALRDELLRSGSPHAQRMVFMSTDAAQLDGVGAPGLQKPFSPSAACELIDRCLLAWGHLDGVPLARQA